MQQLIELAKRLQSLAAAGSTDSSTAAPAAGSNSPWRHPWQEGCSSTSAHQVLSEVFRTLAVLGDLLTPSPSLLQQAVDDMPAPHAPASSTADAVHVANASWQHSQPIDSASCMQQQLRLHWPATAGAAEQQTACSSNSNGVQDTAHIPTHLSALQARLYGALHDKAALQRRCDELQRQLQQQAGSSAAAASQSVQQLAEVTGLQAEKLQLHQEVRHMYASQGDVHTSLHNTCEAGGCLCRGSASLSRVGAAPPVAQGPFSDLQTIIVYIFRPPNNHCLQCRAAIAQPRTTVYGPCPTCPDCSSCDSRTTTLLLLQLLAGPCVAFLPPPLLLLPLLQVEALQRSAAASQSALQLLREDHAQQTSRLSAANAEVLRLRGHVSSLEIAMQQQQQDVASALCIVAGREREAAAATAQGRQRPDGSGLQCPVWHDGFTSEGEAHGSQPAAAAAAAAALLTGSTSSPMRHQPGGVDDKQYCSLATASRVIDLGARAAAEGPRAGFEPTSHLRAGAGSIRPCSISANQLPSRIWAHAAAAVGQPATMAAAAAAAAKGSAEVSTGRQGNSGSPAGCLEVNEGPGSPEAGTAAEALQQHRRCVSVRPVDSPPHLYSSSCNPDGITVGCSGSSAATGRPLSPGARYSALVADADSALARLAQCRKAAAAAGQVAASSGSMLPGVSSAAAALSAQRAYRPGCVSEAGALGGGVLGSSGLAAARSSYGQLLCGRLDGKLAAAGLLQTAPAAACVASDAAAAAAGSSGLHLDQLCAELAAMDGDLEAAEAALQAASSRFGGGRPAA